MFSKVRRTPENKSKYKYAFNSKLYEVDVGKQKSVSFDDKVGATRLEQVSFTFPDKTNSNKSFTLEKLNNRIVEE